jgi:predicted regulator of Ras-like GTPase activity (Roadblock/LC7/MglB family)
MTIPFLDLFKKISSRFGSTSTEEAPAEPVIPVRAPKKPASERLSKTVLPHTTTRMSAPSDPFRNSGPAVAGRSFGSPMQLGPERITSAPKKAQPTSPLPPALAKALEPKLERTISLQIADLIDRVPAGYIKPVEILDSAMRVSLKASEIEKGMPEKNPTVALPSLYQQVPEIFLKGVRPDDETRVALPYEKVLDQFQSAHVRDDQVRDPAVPQVDTPILKATIQDSEKFGTKIEPIEAASLPSVPVKHATAESIAAAEPDAIVQSKAKLTISNRPAVSLYAPDIRPKSEPPQSPSRTGGPSQTGSIPFDLSPNGTGGSASERVPASSGPPVPTPLPFTPELAKIAFGSSAEKPVEKPKAPEAKKPEAKPAPAKPALKLAETTETSSKPKAESKSKPEPKQKSETKQKPASTPAPASEETPIKLSLKAVFKNLPAFQLNSEISAIAEEAQLALPLSLVEPQLAGGRVVVAADIFRDALPENYREMFQADDIGTPVTLPLEEVLKSLPATILKLRDDQEQTAVDKDFETPFSIKAKEDAERLKPAAAPVEKPADKTAEKTDDKKIETAPAAEKKLEPKEVVAEVRALSGVKACAITFSDGLSLAGELPAEKAADGLCAVAPSILERVSQHLRATKLGPLVTATFYTSDSAVSFFARGNLCLTALHGSSSLAPETRTRIAELVEKLSNNYTHPEK